ncbi:MAG: hypothetical protein HHAS10_00220 [Candidatus Altimarinota bacterium]
MARKFSEILITEDLGIIDLIHSKIQKFRDRFSSENDPAANALNNAMAFIEVKQVRNIDQATKDIFELIQKNPNAIMTDSMEGLWDYCGERYSSLYKSIRGFNESGPGVHDILISNEWQNFEKNIKSQFHEFDNYQNRYSEKFEKINELESRTYTLLSLVKSAILESKGISEQVKLPDGFEEANKIADSLLKNKSLIESGIESSKSIQNFNVNNIDEALKNVGEMFYNKDTYIPFQNPKWTWKDFMKFIKFNIGEAIVVFSEDFFKSPKWWLLLGMVPLITIFSVLWSEYNFILISKDVDLKKYQDYWQILVSTHIIFVSFVGYIVVFCFGNYRKLEARMESYKFRSILTKSFGYLIKSADDEQKKILYPKALDAIFKDLPEANIGQDLNINLPVTEIIKGLNSK